MDYKINAGMLRGQISSPAFIMTTRKIEAGMSEEKISSDTHSVTAQVDPKHTVLNDVAEVMAKHQITRLDIYLDPVEFHLVNKGE